MVYTPPPLTRHDGIRGVHVTCMCEKVPLLAGRFLAPGVWCEGVRTVEKRRTRRKKVKIPWTDGGTFCARRVRVFFRKSNRRSVDAYIAHCVCVCVYPVARNNRLVRGSRKPTTTCTYTHTHRTHDFLPRSDRSLIKTAVVLFTRRPTSTSFLSRNVAYTLRVFSDADRPPAPLCHVREPGRRTEMTVTGGRRQRPESENDATFRNDRSRRSFRGVVPKRIPTYSTTLF